MKDKKITFKVRGKDYTIFFDTDNVTLDAPYEGVDKKGEPKTHYVKSYHGNIYQALKKVFDIEELGSDSEVGSAVKIWQETLEDLKRCLIEAHGKFPLRKDVPWKRL